MVLRAVEAIDILGKGLYILFASSAILFSPFNICGAAAAQITVTLSCRELYSISIAKNPGSKIHNSMYFSRQVIKLLYSCLDDGLWSKIKSVPGAPLATLMKQPNRRMIMPLTKPELRKFIDARRKQLEEAAIDASNRRVMENLLSIPAYRQAKTIFCFVGTPAEIDTKPIILDALAQGKRVGVPRCITKGVMRAYEIRALSDLQNGKYDIEEPKEGCIYVDPREIDFVIAPCVTCNATGQRLGYGGGFYDRYLESLSVPKAALCRSALMYEEIPLESHDKPVDIVVTDQQIYWIGRRFSETPAFVF
jgi:5-formyltetrahydrofolate cyclo-ligase